MTRWSDLPPEDDGLVAVVSWHDPADAPSAFGELLTPPSDIRRLVGIINHRGTEPATIGPEFALRLSESFPRDGGMTGRGESGRTVAFRVGGNEHSPPAHAIYHVIGSPLLPPWTDAYA